MGARRARVLVVIVMTLGAVVCAGHIVEPMFRGYLDLSDDLGAFHYPMRVFYSRCLQAGDRFDWHPGLFRGFYLQGEGQVGMYHPLHLVLYRLIVPEIALHLEVLASYLFAFAGTLLLLRHWRLPGPASTLGAFLFTFAGFNQFHYGHVNAVAIVAHLPWALFTLDVAIRSGDARARAWGRLGVGLVTASQVLLGYPQYMGITLVAEALGITLFTISSGLTEWHRLLAWAWAKALGVAAAGLQLLPTIDVLAHSTRGRPPAWWVGFGSLPPVNLVQSVAPYVFRARVLAPKLVIEGGPNLGLASSITDWRAREFGLYNTVAVPILLIWLVLRWRSLSGPLRKLAGAFAILAGVGLLLAFGENTPLFAIYRRLPLTNLFRLPARFVVLYHFATAILAAVGFADLGRVARSKGGWGGRSLAWLLLPLALGLAFVLVPEWLLPPSVRDLPRATLGTAFLGPVFLGLAGGFVVLGARGWRWALLALALVVVVDANEYGTTYMHMYRKNARDVLLTARLPRVPPGTVLALPNPVTCDLYQIDGCCLVGGYAGLMPTRYLDYDREVAQRVAGTMARWEPTRPGDLEPFANPMPRAYLVPEAISSATLNGGKPGSDPTSDLERIDLTRQAIIPAGERLGLAGDSPPGTAHVIRDRPGSIAVITEAPSRQLLVLTESHHSGWKARVDGHPVPVVRANGDFLACVVGAGQHRVSLLFAPASLRAGGWLSAWGGLMLMGSLVASLWRLRLDHSRRGLAAEFPTAQTAHRPPGPYLSRPIVALSANPADAADD